MPALEFRKKSEPTHFAVSHQNQLAAACGLTPCKPVFCDCKLAPSGSSLQTWKNIAASVQSPSAYDSIQSALECRPTVERGRAVVRVMYVVPSPRSKSTAFCNMRGVDPLQNRNNLWVAVPLYERLCYAKRGGSPPLRPLLLSSIPKQKAPLPLSPSQEHCFLEPWPPHFPVQKDVRSFLQHFPPVQSSSPSCQTNTSTAFSNPLQKALLPLPFLSPPPTTKSTALSIIPRFLLPSHVIYSIAFRNAPAKQMFEQASKNVWSRSSRSDGRL